MSCASRRQKGHGVLGFTAIAAILIFLAAYVFIA
jgi:hypothetical protein